MGTETTVSSNKGRPGPARRRVTDPMKTVRPTSSAHLHGRTDLGPSLASCEPGSVFGTLETVLGMLVCRLPSAGLAEINSFLMSPPLSSLPLDFFSSE